MRLDFLDKIKWMKTKKYPVVGKVFKAPYEILKFAINIITAIPAMINTIFLEICIWLALMPNLYVPNVSDIEKVPLSNTGLQQAMEVNDTPAGFVSMDCITNAQDIVNRVHQEAVN